MAIRLRPGKSEVSLRPVWVEEQSSFGYSSLVGPDAGRVIVASDIPAFHESGSGFTDPYLAEQVVWRDAASGRELARSALLTPMSKGAALSPGPDGTIYYPGAAGQVVELSVTAV